MQAMLKLDNTEKNDMNVSTPCSESISHNVAMIWVDFLSSHYWYNLIELVQFYL